MIGEDLRELAADIEHELSRLGVLASSVADVRREIEKGSAPARFLYESLALELHNFYTGCERVFRIVASELNGSVPSEPDWHRRLLERMASSREGRPAVVSPETARRLAEYLGFRRVVRNLYGYELEPDRVRRLAESLPEVWDRTRAEILAFSAWLRRLAESAQPEIRHGNA